LNKQNEEKSTIRQAIIEVQTAAVIRNDDDLAAAAAQLLKKLDEKKIVQQEAERKLKLKQYTQESIDFSKVVLAEKIPEKFFLLSDQAKSMLFMLSRIPKYGNLIQISNETLAVFANKSDKNARLARNELLESGFLRIIEPAKKDHPAVYEVSTELFSVGKQGFSKQEEEKSQYFNDNFQIVVSKTAKGEKYTGLFLKGAGENEQSSN